MNASIVKYVLLVNQILNAVIEDGAKKYFTLVGLLLFSQNHFQSFDWRRFITGHDHDQLLVSKVVCKY